MTDRPSRCCTNRRHLSPSCRCYSGTGGPHRASRAAHHLHRTTATLHLDMIYAIGLHSDGEAAKGWLTWR